MPTITSITGQPLLELSPAYRPLEYNVIVSGDPANIPAALEVGVQVNGTQFKGRIPVEAFAFDNSGASALSSFNFNVAERVQAFFNMANFFPPVAAPIPLVNPNNVALVKIAVYTLYPNASGELVDAGTEIFSQTVPVINAWRRAEEEATLAPYDVGNVGTTTVKFLTRKPSRSIVCLDDTEFLGLYTRNLFSFRIIAYDQNGVEQANGQLLTGATQFGLEELVVLPVGPANINAVDAGDWLVNTDQVVIDSDTWYYVVQAGWHCPDGNFYALSEIRRYYLVPSSCRKHRVHFMNSFGVPDSVSIFNNEQVEFLTKSETFTRPLPASFGIVDEQKSRVQTIGRIEIKSPISNITNEERVWLAREMSMAPMVRLEQAGQYIPAVIKDGDFVVKDSDNPLDNITFRIEYSQEEYSQRK